MGKRPLHETLTSAYGMIGIVSGFKFKVMDNFEEVVAKDYKIGAWHEFCRSDLPTSIDFSYRPESSDFNVSMSMPLTPSNASTLPFRHIQGQVEFFSDFNKFLASNGYRATEYKSDAGCIDFTYYPILASTPLDIQDLGLFLERVDAYLRVRPFKRA